MAAKIPAALKALDLSRFALRAAQLEKFKPAVTYWAKYYMVNQILSQGLHSADAECTAFTTALMDDLEKLKQAHAQDDAITDDVVAQAYVEQFGLDTLAKAERAMHANQSTAQTADALMASAVFLELLQVWEPLRPEMHARVKFAKFHALRIIKAVKAGGDPNVGNPVEEQAEQGLDPGDPEVMAIEGGDDSYFPPAPAPVAPGLEQLAPDGVDAPSFPTVDEEKPDHDPMPAVSPLEPPRLSPPPQVPTSAAEFYKAPALPPTHQAPASTPKAATGPLEPPFQTPAPLAHPTALATPAPMDTPLQPPPPAPASLVSGPFNTEDAAVAAAQKHAKWAISALNFEDVNTAVRELREALKELGAA